MFETLLNQNVCMYVMIVCGCIGLIGRAVMSSYLARLAKAAERMGTTRKKALLDRAFSSLCGRSVPAGQALASGSVRLR